MGFMHLLDVEHRVALARAREQSEIHFIKVKGHLHEELAKVGVTDDDLAPGETYKDLGNTRADELASRRVLRCNHFGIENLNVLIEISFASR